MAGKCYEDTRKKVPELPSFEQFWKQGIAKYKVKEDTGITMQSFRTNPAKHPLKTPSGKIEIYSSSSSNWLRKLICPRPRAR